MEPSADHCKEIHSGFIAFLDIVGSSGTSSATTDFDSKSQILIEDSVAAHNQYRQGEKLNAWMMSPPSSSYKCSPLFKSQSIAAPSLPPEAQREPSGEQQTVLRYPVWPSRLVNSFRFVRLQTFTTLSHPPDTMSGAAGLGLNLTQETQSVWPSSAMVYLHSPRVFQTYKTNGVGEKDSLGHTFIC